MNHKFNDPKQSLDVVNYMLLWLLLGHILSSYSSLLESPSQFSTIAFNLRFCREWRAVSEWMQVPLDLGLWETEIIVVAFH